jgi:hypothetical protein
MSAVTNAPIDGMPTAMPTRLGGTEGDTRDVCTSRIACRLDIVDAPVS